MPLIYDYLFPAMWLGFLAYWWAISRSVKETERQESAPSRLARLFLIIGAAALLWLPSVPLPLLNERFLPPGAWCFWVGAAVTAGGLLFAVWARRHRKKLEPGRHPEGRSRTHYKWPLCPGSPPHLHRAFAGVCRLRSGRWRMARGAGCSPGFRRTVAQTEA